MPPLILVSGHKEQHEAVLHLPQLLYFTAFDSALLLPTLLSDGPISMVRGALTTGLGSLKFVRYLRLASSLLISDQKSSGFRRRFDCDACRGAQIHVSRLIASIN